MRVSSRGRYALRLMVALARYADEGFMPLRPLLEKENIPIKYGESIMAALSKAGLVEAASGKNGGYRLAAAPDRIAAGDVLRVTEGDLKPVDCQSCDAACRNQRDCPVLPLWQGLESGIAGYLDGVTLRDMEKGIGTRD